MTVWYETIKLVRLSLDGMSSISLVFSRIDVIINLQCLRRVSVGEWNKILLRSITSLRVMYFKHVFLRIYCKDVGIQIFLYRQIYYELFLYMQSRLLFYIIRMISVCISGIMNGFSEHLFNLSKTQHIALL